MAQQLLDLGTTDNDGTGTKLKPGGQIINSNFTEVYADITALQAGLLTNSSTITVSRDNTAIDPDGMNNSIATSDITITIRLNATIAHTEGQINQYKRSAAGNILFAYEGGVTGPAGLQTYNLDDVVSLRFTATNVVEVINPPKNLIGQTAQSATGDGTTTINWQLGNMFNFQFGASDETFTFTAPLQAGTFILKLVQDSVGTRLATFPGTVKWAGGSAPTLTTTATTGTDIITLYWDGTSYFCVDALNFS